MNGLVYYYFAFNMAFDCKIPIFFLKINHYIFWLQDLMAQIFCPGLEVDLEKSTN